MKIQFVNNSKTRLPRKWCDKILQFLGKNLNSKEKKLLQGTELTVVFLELSAAKKLNKQFRDRNYATDVLSFSEAPSHRAQYLGELILCPAVLKKQAKEHHHSFQVELAYMLIHGVLHLLGYDHEGRGAMARRNEKEMMTLQDQLFDRLRETYDF